MYLTLFPNLPPSLDRKHKWTTSRGNLREEMILENGNHNEVSVCVCSINFPTRQSNMCETQNSGLCSKEGKLCDPINQSSRCNTQEGLLSVAQTRWLWSPGRQSTPNSKLGKLLWAKKPHIISILHTGYKVIGYTFAKQSYWYKLRGLHVYKAILLAQTPRAFVQI